MFLGFIFFFVALAIALPIAGHASWHAYRELITEE
jgi:Predicted integral membrane protein